MSLKCSFTYDDSTKVKKYTFLNYFWHEKLSSMLIQSEIDADQGKEWNVTF